MTSAISPRRELLIAVVCSVLIILLTGGGAVFVVSDGAFKSAITLTNAAEIIYHRYSDNVNWSTAVAHGLNAMFDELDPYSGLIEPHSYHEMEEELSGGYGGLGIAIYALDEGLFLHAITEGSPANRAGLRIGDIILRADSVDFTDTSRIIASMYLRGEEGSKTLLTVYRPSSLDTFNVEVTRGRVEFSSVPYAGMTSDSLLYIRISDFEAGVSDDILEALDSFLPSKDAPVKGIILDLRDNPGGLLNEAIAAADLFLEQGELIVGTQGRSIWETEKFYSEDADFTFGRPIAILVNDQTASAAEILSGALKYNGRATLVGDTTFGKGLVQGHLSMPDGEGLRLTISRYYLEGRRFLNDFDSTLNEVGHGLVPDTVLSFVDYQPFIATLEHELYFHRFASLYAAQLDSIKDSVEAMDSWGNQFAGYCYNRGFAYQSELTEWAEALAFVAKEEGVSQPTLTAATHIFELSHRNDSLLFSRFKEYIFHRLTWLAVETLRFESQGFAEVEVPKGREVQETANILRQKISSKQNTPLP